METPKKHLVLKITAGILILASIAAFFIYRNFNKLLTESLNTAFNSSIVSDVYELKFENLSVNILDGNIKVYNVVMRPLASPVHNYPYINSTLKLTTKNLQLENVNITMLLKTGVLQLKKIVVQQPEIELNITSKLPVFFPFNDSTTIDKQGNKKKFITAFSLNELKLADAAIHIINTAKEREFNISKLNISLKELFIDQQAGKDVFSNKLVDLSIGESTGSLQKDALKYVSFKDFKIKIDSISFEKTLDTVIYQFSNFTSDLSALNIQTADSVYHLALGSFKLSYKDKLIQFNNVAFEPNVSNNVIQRKYKYQHTQFAATIGSLLLKQVNFDSLIFHRKISIDEISIDKVNASIYKDKTKPLDKTRFPVYFGEQIMSVPVPLHIKELKATNVNLVNTERKPDSSYAKVNITRGNVSIKNISNHSSNKLLIMSADAYIENKAHAYLSLGFDYSKPQFSIDGRVKQFNLPDINSLLQAYTPAKIFQGTADEISFSGMVYRTSSTGTMKFLYHNLDIDLALKKQPDWVNSFLGFAANNAINSANPASAGEPPRIVKFNAVRDMNKGFFNIIIKSILSGFKETMIMSKENRKAHKKAKKEFKGQQKN